MGRVGWFYPAAKNIEGRRDLWSVPLPRSGLSFAKPLVKILFLRLQLSQTRGPPNSSRDNLREACDVRVFVLSRTPLLECRFLERRFVNAGSRAVVCERCFGSPLYLFPWMKRRASCVAVGKKQQLFCRPQPDVAARSSSSFPTRRWASSRTPRRTWRLSDGCAASQQAM